MDSLRAAMASANKLLYQVSTALLVLLFALAGIMKLVPNLSPETHGELVRAWKNKQAKREVYLYS